jgi:hypothetical protein
MSDNPPTGPTLPETHEQVQTLLAKSNEQDARWERAKYILTFSAAGGLGIVLTLFLVYIQSRQNMNTQTFIQTKLIDALEKSSVTTSQAADALKNTADALESQVNKQQNIDDSIKRMTAAQEELTHEFRNFIEQTKQQQEQNHAPPN